MAEHPLGSEHTATWELVSAKLERRPTAVASPERESTPPIIAGGEVGWTIWLTTWLQSPAGRLRIMLPIAVASMDLPPLALDSWLETTEAVAEVPIAAALPPRARLLLLDADAPADLPAPEGCEPAATLPLRAAAKPMFSIFVLKVTSMVIGA